MKREESRLGRHPLLHRLFNAAVILFCLYIAASVLIDWMGGYRAEPEYFSRDVPTYNGGTSGKGTWEP